MQVQFRLYPSIHCACQSGCLSALWTSLMPLPVICSEALKTTFPFSIPPVTRSSAPAPTLPIVHRCSPKSSIICRCSPTILRYFAASLPLYPVTRPIRYFATPLLLDYVTPLLRSSVPLFLHCSVSPFLLSSLPDVLDGVFRSSPRDCVVRIIGTPFA